MQQPRVELRGGAKWRVAVMDAGGELVIECLLRKGGYNCRFHPRIERKSVAALGQSSAAWSHGLLRPHVNRTLHGNDTEWAECDGPIAIVAPRL